MNSEHFIKIMTVDDPHLIREGLAAVIGTQQDMELIAHASTGTEAIQQYHQHLPDVTLMNLRMPDQRDRCRDGDPLGVSECAHYYPYDI
jgi:DNA-binding NarL/FixJ family response regulator